MAGPGVHTAVETRSQCMRSASAESRPAQLSPERGAGRQRVHPGRTPPIHSVGPVIRWRPATPGGVSDLNSALRRSRAKGRMRTHESAVPTAADVEVTDLTLGDIESAVTVIVPAYNEADHILEVLTRLRAVLETTNWRHEIIVVDDGSTDSTGEVAARAGYRVIRHPRNIGYGAALKRGVAAASHPWILITDADGTYPSEAIPHMLDLGPLHDMVVGARIGPNVRIPIERKPAKWVLSRLADYLAGQELVDLNSGLRLIRTELVRRYQYLLPTGFSFTTTITLAAACNGHPVAYVPIDYAKRLGRSKIRPRNAFDFLMLILRTIVFFNPLKVFLPLGALAALAGAVKLAYDVSLGNLSESAIFALLTAVVIWCVGLIADQNSRLVDRR